MVRTNRQARLTDKAIDGWDRTLQRYGVSWTTLIEALGQRLADGDDAWLPEEAIEHARRLDRERYTRRRKDDPG